MPPSPNWCRLTAAGGEDQLLATDPGQRRPALGCLGDRDRIPERDEGPLADQQPTQRGSLGHKGPSGPTMWCPHPSTCRTGWPQHFTTQRGHRCSAPHSIPALDTTAHKISRDKRDTGTGFSRHWQPSPKTPETQGSTTSLSSLPWAAAIQPQRSPSAHPEITDSISNFFFREQFHYNIHNIWANVGFFPPLCFDILTVHSINQSGLLVQLLWKKMPCSGETFHLTVATFQRWLEKCYFHSEKQTLIFNCLKGRDNFQFCWEITSLE